MFLSELPNEVQVAELSPVCPLGTSSVVAEVDPNWSVATVRNTEVVSDATNVLALECALRRRAMLTAQPKSREVVHLVASHRFLRPQAYDDPALLPHFRIFSLCSGGWGTLRFELGSLTLQLGFDLRSLQHFLAPSVPLSVYLTDFHEDDRTALIQEVLVTPLREAFPVVNIGFNDEREAGLLP